ncbi:MAG TPA: sporulation protein YqfD [Clostridiales bacterium]|nr:sporulation protein YqfD [Clostridiales bacterium]
MLFLRLWNYIRGYVIILIEGYYLERFINICTHRQIFLWDVNRSSDIAMTLKVSIQGFKLLRPVAQKTYCAIKIVDKKGLPFILSRYKKRKAFALGALLFFFLINVLASFIWDIEITGNMEIGRMEIAEALFSMGIKPGTLKYKVDVDIVANELMLKMEKLAWVGFEIRGTRALLYLKERQKPPELVAKDIPCNIIAGKDGIIKSVIVKAGQELVTAGDTVTKGQILVTGVIKGKNENEPQKLVHAIAEIEARTWYEANGTVKFKTVETVRTGKTTEIYRLKLLGKETNIPFLKKMDFVNYDKIEFRKVLSLGKDLVLPFELLTEKYYENELVEKSLSVDEAKEAAENKAIKKLMDIIPEKAEILNRIIDFKQNNEDAITANIIIECIEDIGITEEIGGE